MFNKNYFNLIMIDKNNNNMNQKCYECPNYSKKWTDLDHPLKFCI